MSKSGVLLPVRICLALSLVVGLVILAFDGLLWFDNPRNGHATALVVFSVIQAFLLGFSFLRFQEAKRMILFWSILYLVLLLLNPLTAPSIDMPIEVFTLYLMGFFPVSSTPQFSCPFLCPPFLITYDLLIVLQIILVATLLRNRRKQQAV